MTASEALALLETTPRRVTEVSAGITAEHLRTPPSPGEWSAVEILAHIRSCADVRGSAVLRILAEDHPTIRPVSPRIYQRGTDYVELEFAPSLRAFADRRADLLAVLEPLPSEAWGRSARILKDGKELEWSVLYYADWIGSHERIHIAQIEATVETIAATL